MPISPPFLVSFSITGKCNLKCKHCYSESTEKPLPDELSTEEALRTIDELADLGIGLLILDGGEPLLREDFFTIASHAVRKGIITVIGSNGTLIDFSTAKRMVDCGIKAVALSLDGASAETHDSFRGEEGSFKKVLEAATACNRANLPFQFGMVVRRQNLPEIPEMLRLNDELGGSAAEIFDLIPSGRAKKECSGEALNNKERREIMEWLAKKQTDYRVPIRVPACPMYPLLLEEMKIVPKHFPIELFQRIPYSQRGCAAGMPLGYLVIRANGDIHPCMLLQIKLGNVRENKIGLIWEEHPVLIELRSREKLKGECGICRYRDKCAGCRGRALEETGDFMQTDPGCWIATGEINRDERISI